MAQITLHPQKQGARNFFFCAALESDILWDPIKQIALRVQTIFDTRSGSHE